MIDLSECELSKFIESRVFRLVMKMRNEQAIKKGCDYENIPYPESLSVRVVMNTVFIYETIISYNRKNHYLSILLFCNISAMLISLLALIIL